MKILLLSLIPVAIAGRAAAVTSFTEHFSTGDAMWGTSTGVIALDYIATGGPDGDGYVSDALDFSAQADGDTLVLFRAQDEFGSSAAAFEGDWLTDGVTGLSAVVRHNGPSPISFFARLSSPANFPGATAVQFAPVLPNTWTELSFAISESNPAFVTFEGSDFATVFSNIGHVQIGAVAPTDLAGSTTPISFDLDQVGVVVPEPSSILLIIAGAVLVTVRRRN